MTLSPDDVRLDGKVAVVTGGGSGIGAGIARNLAAFGADVVIWERHEETGAAVAESFGGVHITTDVRESDQVDAALATTLERHGHVDVLVNNAGGTFASPLLETSEKGMDALYRANLRHVLVCTQRVARVMVDVGRGGSIVNITSIEGSRAAPGFAAYAAAKAGVINFTQTAALELAPHGIRVNALAPDMTLTEGLEATVPLAARATWPDAIPMGRVGHVDDVAGVAVFLASGLSSYVTGQTIHVDGGTAAAGGWYHHPGHGHYILGPPS